MDNNDCLHPEECAGSARARLEGWPNTPTSSVRSNVIYARSVIYANKVTYAAGARPIPWVAPVMTISGAAMATSRVTDADCRVS